MLMYLKILLFYHIVSFCGAQVTKLRREDLLIRPKRYVTFPEGSNFVATASIVKAIMLKIPKGWNVLVECDAQFKLPSFKDYEKAKHVYRPMYHVRQRRDVYSQFEHLLSEIGLEGSACIESMQCEAELLALRENRTLAEEFLLTIFRIPEIGTPSFKRKSTEECEKIFSKCGVPLLNFLLNPSDG